MTFTQVPDVRVSPVALLLIDVINPMDFEGAKALLPPAISAARNIASLRRRAREAAVRHMARILKADIATSNVLDFRRCAAAASSNR